MTPPPHMNNVPQAIAVAAALPLLPEPPACPAMDTQLPYPPNVGDANTVLAAPPAPAAPADVPTLPEPPP